MTLGALYRCLLDAWTRALGLRVGIHFEERTSIVVEDAAAGPRRTRIEQRTFDADLDRPRGQVVAAMLTAGAIGAETLVGPHRGSRRRRAGTRSAARGSACSGSVRNLFDLDEFGSGSMAVPVD